MQISTARVYRKRKCLKVTIYLYNINKSNEILKQESIDVFTCIDGMRGRNRQEKLITLLHV